MAKEPEDRHASAGELARSATHALTAPEQEQLAGISRPSQAVTVGGESGFVAQSRAGCRLRAACYSVILSRHRNSWAHANRSSTRNPWKFLAAAAIAVAAILGGLGIWLGTRPPQPPQAQRSEPVPSPTRLTTSGANANSDTEFLAASVKTISSLRTPQKQYLMLT